MQKFYFKIQEKFVYKNFMSIIAVAVNKQ